MSAVKLVLVGTCGLLLLTGCGGGTTPTTVTHSAPGANLTQTASTAPDNGSALASPDAMRSYVEATSNGGNPDAIRQGLKLAAPNSVAYIYLEHLANTAQAALDGGKPYTKRDVTPVGNNAFKACSDPADEKTCAILGDFKINPAGKVVDLTVNSQVIGPRLTAGSGQVVTAGGAKFTFLTAYKTNTSNGLNMTVKVETGAKPITVNIFSATYGGLDGKPRTASGAMGRTNIAAKSNTIVVIGFDLVNVGGNVTLDGCVGKDCSGVQFTAVIKVG
jgi:hypothetical protein